MSNFSTGAPRLPLPRRTTDGLTARSSFARVETGHYIVLGGLTALITVRFFTEALHAVPRAANFVDVPLLFVFAGAAAVSQQRFRPVQESTFFILSILFLALTTVSALVNFGRVDVFPVLAFVYGILGPPAFYLATYRIWRAGRSRAVSNVIVGLAAIQFVAIVLFDLPRFIRTRNPDLVSGTFGTNAYQLVFFLLLFIALITGITTFEPQSRIRFLAIPFIACAFLAIFLAQYRTLLLTTALATLFLGLLIMRRQRGFFMAAAAVAGLIATLLVIVVYVPTNKFTQAFDAIHNDPTYFIDSRLDPGRDVYHLYGDDWTYALIGTGPGTYSSRAWQTFSNLSSTSSSDVAGPYATWLMGGHPYQTDVSNKYVVPRLKASASTTGTASKYGTRQFSDPFSSYLSLLAEVGILAAAFVVSMYVLALVRLVRAANHLARFAEPGDALPALVLAAATAFFVLLQMAVFGDWFQTARVTVPTWIIFGIVVRELQARKDTASFPH